MIKILYLGGLGENDGDFLYSRIKKFLSKNNTISGYFLFEDITRFPDDFNNKIESIIENNQNVDIIIGHSLGAYVSLYFHKIYNKFFLIETSLEPKRVFKDDNIHTEKIETLLELNKDNNIIFVGAENAGGKLSLKYHKMSENNSTFYNLKNCDHSLSKQENFNDLVEILNSL